jgi:hypothetical protein
MWGGLFEVKPGARTGIHHHGVQQTIAYVLSGVCEVRWGLDGEFAASAEAGDFIHVPAFLLHMEINPSSSRPFRWVVVRSTSTPIVVNLPEDTWRSFSDAGNVAAGQPFTGNGSITNEGGIVHPSQFDKGTLQTPGSEPNLAVCSVFLYRTLVGVGRALVVRTRCRDRDWIASLSSNSPRSIDERFLCNPQTLVWTKPPQLYWTGRISGDSTSPRSAAASLKFASISSRRSWSPQGRTIDGATSS